jgi:hypothetical protein
MAVHKEVRAHPSHHALQPQKQEPEERVAERLTQHQQPDGTAQDQLDQQEQGQDDALEERVEQQLELLELAAVLFYGCRRESPVLLPRLEQQLEQQQQPDGMMSESTRGRRMTPRLAPVAIVDLTAEGHRGRQVRQERQGHGGQGQGQGGGGAGHFRRRRRRSK